MKNAFRLPQELKNVPISSIEPQLKIVAAQNNLNIKNPRQFFICAKILVNSVFYN